MKRKFILSTIALFSIIVCSCNSKALNYYKLSGKRFDLSLPADVYRISFLNQTSLKWECIKGKNNGKSGTEAYYRQDIRDNVIYIKYETQKKDIDLVFDFQNDRFKGFVHDITSTIPIAGNIIELRRD